MMIKCRLPRSKVKCLVFAYINEYPNDMTFAEGKGTRGKKTQSSVAKKRNMESGSDDSPNTKLLRNLRGSIIEDLDNQVGPV